MIAILIACIVFWLACAAVTAGMYFAESQCKFPEGAKERRREDMGEAWVFGIVFGPLGLVLEFFLSGFAKYGWRMR